MKPLLDADILRYEIGFSGQVKNEEGGQEPLPFDRVAELLDAKVALICDEVRATEEPTLYLTADTTIEQIINRRDRYLGKPEVKFKGNFRESIATTKPYKGTRKADKPYHFRNLTAYILSKYDCKVADGIEADDLMAIDQTYNTIICSRDKDLRMVEGYHYSWECGLQPSLGPVCADKVGWLEKKGNKVIGYGDKFFYYQTLTGDSVDNIGGVRGVGPVKAFDIIEDCEPNSRSLFERVRSVYQDVYGEGWKDYMKEQVDLLWMVREIKDDKPVLFKPPSKEA